MADRRGMSQFEIFAAAPDQAMFVRQEPELGLVTGRFGELQHRVEVLPFLDPAAVEHHRAPVVGWRIAGDPDTGGKERIHRDDQPFRLEGRILPGIMIRHGLAYENTASGALKDPPFDRFIPFPKMGVARQIFFFGGESVDVDEYFSGTQPRQNVLGQM